MVTHLDAIRGINIQVFDQVTKVRAQACEDHFPKEKWATYTIISFLQIYKRSVQRVAQELSLIDERVCQEDVVRAPTTSGERPLKGVDNIFADHKRHKAVVKRASEYFAQATSNRQRTVVSWVLLGSLLMKGGNVGLFPDRWETTG